MKEVIIFSVKKGSKIVGNDGSVVLIDGEVPENALDLIEAGATHLMFKQEAIELLKKQPEERLLKIIEMRKSQKLMHDVSILEMALAQKKSGKDSPEPNAGKNKILPS